MKQRLKSIGYMVAVAGAIAGISQFDAHGISRAEAGQIWATQPQPAVQAVPPATQQPDVETLNRTFTGLAEKLSPSVVNIYTKTSISRPQGMPRFPGGPDGNGGFFFPEPFGSGGPSRGPSREAQALGSGFVINQDGYIITNSHVVRMAGQAANEIMVKFAGEESGKGHAAKVVGFDEVTDVALLKLVDKKEGLRIAPLGDSDKAKQGELVVAIGNPFGHTNTITHGMVSAVGRNVDGLGLRSDFIQTSASINPGNSGGPLFNLKGEVIGINTAIDARAQGIGFAIPINTAKNVVAQLVTNGKVARGWMGIAIQDLSEDIAGYMKLKAPEGVLVREVMPNEPAALAGVETYDVIRKVNGQLVKNTRELLRQMDKIAVGETAKIELLRNGQTKSVSVRIGEQPKQS